MADSGRRSKKSPGDVLQMTASLYNDMIDSVEEFKNRTGPGRKKAPEKPYLKDSGIVFVKNTSSNRRQFEVVGIVDALFDPSDSDTLPEFKQRPALEVDLPECEYVSRFAILLEPINENDVGRAVVSGLVQVCVDIQDESHEYADIKPCDPSCLMSYENGSAQILTREGGTGEQWCIVRLSNNPPFEVTCCSSSTHTTEEATTPSTTTGTTEEATTESTSTGTSESTSTGTTESTSTGTTGTGTTESTSTGTTEEGTTESTSTGTTEEGTTDSTSTGTTDSTSTGTTEEPGTTESTSTGTTEEATTGTGSTESTSTGTTEEEPETTESTSTGTTEESTTQTGTTVTGTTSSGEDCGEYVCEGDCVVELEVVTDVQCVDGSIEVTKAAICLNASQVSEGTTEGA